MMTALGKAKEAEETMDNMADADALVSIAQTMAELQKQAAFAHRVDDFVGGVPVAHRDVRPHSHSRHRDELLCGMMG
jgi:hypothetical protein